MVQETQKGASTSTQVTHAGTPGRALKGYLRAHRAPLVIAAAGLAVACWSALNSSDPSLSSLDITHDVSLAPTSHRPWTSARTYVPGFLVARDANTELDDIYYAESRIRSDGTKYDVRRVSNLTRTPQAREVLVAHHGQTALFAVEVFGQIQALLLVDFRGDERDTSKAQSRFDRTRLSISNLLGTGTMDGVGQRLYGLEKPSHRLQATFSDGVYIVDLPDGPTTIHPDTGALGGRGQLRYQPRYFAQKDTVPWLVDSIRGLPWVGPRKIALLEKFVFGQRDRFKRAAFALGFIDETEGLRTELTPLASDVLDFDATTIMASDEWPPKTVQPITSPAEDGEGEWIPTGPRWLRRLPNAPPAFYKTALRIDPERPYDVVVLIAMDMRQLHLGMVAGTVNPHSSFGTRGTGIIPREPVLIDRLVAAFNGGFQTGHGAYGMVVDRQTILPAMPYAATVTLHDDQHVKMGNWHNSMKVPDDVVSLRQNLPPLTADGVFNPTKKRSRWGGTSSDLDLINTTRSGMGLCGDHTLMYAWCRSCSANSIGRVFIAAGCNYGMHLDMNPTHTGWSWYRAESTAIQPNGDIADVRSAKGAKRMGFKVERYIERDVKDFFYLTLRPGFVSSLPPAPRKFAPWSVEHVPSGSEGFLPVGASTRSDSGTLLVALDTTRLAVHIRRGDDEPDPTATLPPAAPVTLQQNTIVLDAGLAHDVGFIVEGRILAPLAADQPALVFHEGTLRVVHGTDQPRKGTVRGGRFIVRNGRATPALADGTIRAIALHETTLYYAEGASGQVVRTLLDLGVQTAVSLPPSTRPTPLAFIRNGQGLAPVTGEQIKLDTTWRSTTQIYFEVRPEGPRVSRLRLEDVELSAAEARRQRRLRNQIKAARQELRTLQNAKYIEWKTKTAAP